MKKKKWAALLMCLPLALTGCGTTGYTGADAAGEAVDIWATYATEKILQDRTDLYDSVRLPAEVTVEACKGEYESAQIILTAKEDVAAYNAEIVADLTGPDGATFPKANIDLRHEKYIDVSIIHSDYNSPPTGRYPDALVPLETIVAYGENTIAAGQNQGLYITFDVPAAQAPGTYTGSLRVTYDGAEQTLPVTLTVYDFTVSQETRSESYFNLGFSQHLGELDSTQDMWRKYAEALVEYRISPSSLLRTTTGTEENMDAYIEEVEYFVNLGMSTINSPWKTGEGLTRFLVKLAEKSVEMNKNLIDMVIVKGIDEPSVGKLPTVTTETAAFNSGVDNAIAQFDSIEGTTTEFIAEMKASAEKIPYIIALQYNRSEATDKAGVDTYCPLYDKYDTEESRALYDDQGEKGRWWYGCINPKPPYPTYHTEDTLVSARSVGWMMSEYDVIGNLYWSATVYARWDGSVYNAIEDYYSGNAERFRNCNGDGYLFYPGAPYGIDGPVASIRLEAIRDGNEEYEILYDLNAAYTEAGLSADNIQRNISDLIYSGTKVRYNNISAQFDTARKAMIQLAMLAEAGVFVTDVTDDSKGTLTYKITADETAVVKNHGETLSGTPAGDGKVGYTIVVTLTDETNTLALSVEKDGKTYAFDYNLGGKATYYDAAALYTDTAFADGNATVTAALEDGRIRLDVGAVSDKSHQSVRYTADVLGSIGAGTKRLVLYMDNGEETSVSFRLLVRLSGDDLNTELYSGTLQPGGNVLDIDLTGVSIAENKTIQYADFYFSLSPGEYPARTLYLKGLTVYDK